MALPFFVFGVFGFVIMRFRQQQVMTLAEYFEKRFNKSVRLLAGLVQAVSGILNLAIFPIAGSTFLVYFMGLPEVVLLFGWELNPIILLMTVMIGLAIFFTFIGGMVSVVLTDFIQSVVIAVALIGGTTFVLWQTGFEEVHHTMQTELGPRGYNPFAESPRKAAASENAEVSENENPESFANAELAANAELYANAESAENAESPDKAEPPATGSYGFWFFAWLVIGLFGGIGFAPQLQRIASTDSPETARQMYLLGMIFSKGREVVLLFWGIAALGALGAVAQEGFSQQEWSNVAPALFLGKAFPIAIKGFFLAGLIAAFISTVDSYLLTYASIISNDLVCPLLGKPLSPRQHIALLRGSVIVIALFLWLFGVVYTPKEEVMYYLMLTGTMFWGTGLALVGGLYWKRATAPAAFVTIAVLCILPPGDMLCRRFVDGYPVKPEVAGVFSTLLAIGLFVLISLLTGPSREVRNA